MRDTRYWPSPADPSFHGGDKICRRAFAVCLFSEENVIMVQATLNIETTRSTVDWNQLKDRIHAKQATVCVLGLGYVGLPLSVAFAKKGFSVLGFDVNEEKVAELKAGHSYIIDVQSSDIAQTTEQQKFTATSSADDLRRADAIIICVPTPCQRNRTPDLSYIESAARIISGILRPGQLIVLESTTYPGTTEELLLPILEQSGLSLYEDFQVAFSPERIDPGNPNFHVENTPKVVGGLGNTAGNLACALYDSVVEYVVRVDSPREAEMTKLIENTFRHVNIALANELAIIANKMGVNIWQSINAAASKPFGFMPFYPGPGVGGHCIPIDPHYLSWKAREMGCETGFIELAERVNHGMPEHVVRLVVDAVNRDGKSIRNARVLVLGIAYKRDIDDMRESPAIEVINQLFEHGADVAYSDPYVPTCRFGDRELKSVDLDAETLSESDCVVIITDHTCVNKEMVVSNARLIIDTRNSLGEYRSPSIIRL